MPWACAVAIIDVSSGWAPCVTSWRLKYMPALCERHCCKHHEAVCMGAHSSTWNVSAIIYTFYLYLNKILPHDFYYFLWACEWLYWIILKRELYWSVWSLWIHPTLALESFEGNLFWALWKVIKTFQCYFLVCEWTLLSHVLEHKNWRRNYLSFLRQGDWRTFCDGPIVKFV